MAKQNEKNTKMGTGTVFGIIVGVFVVATVIAIVVNNAPDPNGLTVNSPTHPHTFGYAPDGKTLWIGTHTGMYEYNEGKWTRTVPAIAENDVMGYFVDANDTNVIYISGHGFVQRSTDGGETWAPIENDMPNAPKPDVPDAHMLAQDPNDPKHLYVFLVQHENNIYETKDGGETWNVAGTIAPDAYSMSVAPGKGSSLLVAGEAGLREYSFAGNKNDVAIRLEKPTYAVMTRSNGEVIVLGREGFQRTDNYKIWTPMNIDFGGEQPLGIRASHTQPDRLSIVTGSYSVYESTDNGQTWNKK